MFQLISDAWDTLKDGEKRREYTQIWREYQKQKLLPAERAELSRKEGNDYYKKGQIYARENNIPQALNAYQAAIEKYSEGIDVGRNTQPPQEDHRLYSNRALCYAVLRDWGRAKQDAATVIRLRPNFMKGWFTLVRAYIMENNLDQAQNYLIQGLEKCGNHEDLVKLQEEINQAKQEWEERQQAGERARMDGSYRGKSPGRASEKDTKTGNNNANNSNLNQTMPVGGSGQQQQSSNSPIQSNAQQKSPRLPSGNTPPNSIGKETTPRENSTNNTRPLSYREYRDVTPSKTPPTPVQTSRSLRGYAQAAMQGLSQSYSSFGGARAGGGDHQNSSSSRTGNTPPRNITPPNLERKLSGTGNFNFGNAANQDPLDQSLTSAFGGGNNPLSGTANFGSSIGYSRTPPRQVTPPKMPGGGHGNFHHHPGLIQTSGPTGSMQIGGSSGSGVSHVAQTPAWGSGNPMGQSGGLGNNMNNNNNNNPMMQSYGRGGMTPPKNAGGPGLGDSMGGFNRTVDFGQPHPMGQSGTSPLQQTGGMNPYAFQRGGRQGSKDTTPPGQRPSKDTGFDPNASFSRSKGPSLSGQAKVGAAANNRSPRTVGSGSSTTPPPQREL